MKGIDISQWQGDIDLAPYRNGFVIVRGAAQEAEACLQFLNGRKPRLGVWFDMEDADGYKAKNGFPSDGTINAMCRAFCDEMRKAGNKTGVYASLSWFDTHIGETGYDRWIAAWGANDGVNGEARGGREMRKHRGDSTGGARRKVGQRRREKAEARHVVLRSCAGRSEPDIGGMK